MKHLFKLLILAPILPILNVLADDESRFSDEKSDNLRAEFFVSQNFIYTSQNKMAGSSKNISDDKREIGALASYSINEHVDLRGMALYEQYGDRYENKAHLEFGLADIHEQYGDTILGFRIGRLKNTMGLYNDKRTNPYLRDTDFPPQSLYRDQLKHSAVSGDGIQLYMSSLFPESILDLEVSAFKAELNPEEDAVNVLLNIPMKSGSFRKNNVFSYHVSYKDPELGIVLKYDRLNLDFDYSANPDNPVSLVVPSGKMMTRIEYLSARKYFNKFDITTELIKIKRSGELWDYILDGKNYEDPYGLNLVFRHKNGDFTYLLGYNLWYTDISDKDGRIHEINTGISRHRYYQRDLNFAIKYKLNTNWIFKAEHHIMQGTNILSILENPDMNSLNPKWNLTSVSVTYRF